MTGRECKEGYNSMYTQPGGYGSLASAMRNSLWSGGTQRKPPVPGQMPQGGQVPGQMPGQMPGQVPGQMPVPGQVPGQLPGGTAGSPPQQGQPAPTYQPAPGQIPGKTPGIMDAYNARNGGGASTAGGDGYGQMPSGSVNNTPTSGGFGGGGFGAPTQGSGSAPTPFDPASSQMPAPAQQQKPRLPVSPLNTPIRAPQAPQAPQPTRISEQQGDSFGGIRDVVRKPYVDPFLGRARGEVAYGKGNESLGFNSSFKPNEVAPPLPNLNRQISNPVSPSAPVPSQQQGLDRLTFLPGQNGGPPIGVLPDGTQIDQQGIQQAVQSGTLNGMMPPQQPAGPRPTYASSLQPQQPATSADAAPQGSLALSAPGGAAPSAFSQQQMLPPPQAGQAMPVQGGTTSAPQSSSLRADRPAGGTGSGESAGRGGRTGPTQAEAAQQRLQSLIDSVTGMGKYQFQGQIQNPGSALNMLQREFGLGSADALNLKVSGGSKVDYGWEGNPLYDLLQDSRKKLKQANEANESRYQEAKQGYKDRIATGDARDTSDRQQAQLGYGNRATDIQNQYNQNTNSLFNSLKDRQQDLRGEGQQNLNDTRNQYQNLSDSLRGESRANQRGLEDRYANREGRVIGRGQAEVDEATSSRSRNLDRTKSLGREDRKRIADNSAQERARAISQSVMSGLGNSTVLGSMLSGVMDRTNRANESLSESIDQRNLQADTMMTDRVLGGLRNLAGLDANVSGQGLQFSERGDERAINLGQMIGREQAGAQDRGQQFNQAMGERTSGDYSRAVERSGQFGSQLSSQLTGEGLSADERLSGRVAQGQDRRGLDLLSMIERKDEVGPNLAQLMAAAEGLGQYGRGRAGATTPFSAETGEQFRPQNGGAGGGGNQPNVPLSVPIIGGGGQGDGGGKKDPSDPNDPNAPWQGPRQPPAWQGPTQWQGPIRPPQSPGDAGWPTNLPTDDNGNVVVPGKEGKKGGGGAAPGAPNAPRAPGFPQPGGNQGDIPNRGEMEQQVEDFMRLGMFEEAEMLRAAMNMNPGGDNGGQDPAQDPVDPARAEEARLSKIEDLKADIANRKRGGDGPDVIGPLEQELEKLIGAGKPVLPQFRG